MTVARLLALSLAVLLAGVVLQMQPRAGLDTVPGPGLQGALRQHVGTLAASPRNAEHPSAYKAAATGAVCAALQLSPPSSVRIMVPSVPASRTVPFRSSAQPLNKKALTTRMSRTATGGSKSGTDPLSPQAGRTANSIVIVHNRLNGAVEK